MRVVAETGQNVLWKQNEMSSDKKKITTTTYIEK